MTLPVKFTPHGAEDFDFWERGNKKVLEKIKTLLRDAREHPSTGIGKPERLKHELTGCRSRRITQEYRLVDSGENDVLIIHSCRFHYANRKK